MKGQGESKELETAAACSHPTSYYYHIEGTTEATELNIKQMDQTAVLYLHSEQP